MMEKTLILKHILWMLCLLISYSKFTRTFEKMIAVSPKKYAIMNADHEQRRMHALHDMTVCRRYWVRCVEYR